MAKISSLIAYVKLLLSSAIIITFICSAQSLQFDELENIIDQIVANPIECDYESETHEVVPLADCQSKICSFPKSVCRYNLLEDSWGCWKIPGACLKVIGDPIDDGDDIDPIGDEDYPDDEDYFEDDEEFTPTPPQPEPATTTPTTTTTIGTLPPLRPAPKLPPLPLSTPPPPSSQEIVNGPIDIDPLQPRRKKTKHSLKKIKAIRESIKASNKAKKPKQKSRKKSNRGQKKKHLRSRKRKNNRRKIGRKLSKTNRAKLLRKLKLKKKSKKTKRREPKDWHLWCCYWAAVGDCDNQNPTFMRPVCQQSCGTHTCTFSKFDTCKVNRNPQCTDPKEVLARMGETTPPKRRPTAPKSTGPKRESKLGGQLLPVIKKIKALKVNNAKIQKRFKIKSRDGKLTAFGKYLKRLSPFERYKLMLRIKAYKVQSKKKQKLLNSNLKKLLKLRRKSLKKNKKSVLKKKAVRLARIAKWRTRNAKRIRRLHRKLVSKAKSRAKSRSRLRRLRAARLRRLRAARRKKRVVKLNKKA